MNTADETDDLKSTTDTTATESTDELESVEEVEAPESAEPEKPLSRREALKQALELEKNQGKAEQQSEAPKQAQAVRAPKSWKKEYHEAFSRLDPQLQQYIIQRDTEANGFVDKKAQELAERYRPYEPLAQVIESNKDYFESIGTEPHEGTQTLIAADKWLKENPVEGLLWLAHSFGLSPEQLVQAQRQGRTYPQQMNHSNVAMQRRIAQIEANQQRILKAEQEKINKAIESEIAGYINSKDESGNYLYPYLHDDEVREEVEQMVESLFPTVLKAHPGISNGDAIKNAYEQAVWAIAGTRERELRKQQEAEAQKAKAIARTAKARGVSVKGAPIGSTEFAPQGKTRREILQHVFQNG